MHYFANITVNNCYDNTINKHSLCNCEYAAVCLEKDTCLYLTSW